MTTLQFEIASQPDDITCGPTCLHAIYRYYGDDISLQEVVAATHMLPEGGTLDVFLANHALRRGYRATIYTYNLHLFDPTWFSHGERYVAERLRLQVEHKSGPKFESATKGYRDYIELGGRLRFEELRPSLIRRFAKRGVPVLTGLSSTYLYNAMRERPGDEQHDDIRGEPTGHFVVLAGYNSDSGNVLVADPYEANPYSADGIYSVHIMRLIGAVLLGVMTYDANLLVLEPPKRRRG